MPTRHGHTYLSSYIFDINSSLFSSNLNPSCFAEFLHQENVTKILFLIICAGSHGGSESKTWLWWVWWSECWGKCEVLCNAEVEEGGGRHMQWDTSPPAHSSIIRPHYITHCTHYIHYIHYTYRSHQPGNVWIPLGAGRSWPISPAQDHHFRLTPPSLGLCIIANDSHTEIPGQCHLQPLEGYHWIMWYCAFRGD